MELEEIEVDAKVVTIVVPIVVLSEEVLVVAVVELAGVVDVEKLFAEIIGAGGIFMKDQMGCGLSSCDHILEMFNFYTLHDSNIKNFFICYIVI